MNPWAFNIRHIRAFVKTYELGTLLAASKSVHMSQPAMTQAIARLEDQFDLRLFNRQSDGMVPTKGARLLHPRLKAYLHFVRSRRITHAQIRAFLSLARGGSYAEASRLTGLARASLHRAVSDLEGALKQDLVQKRGRGVELSEAGRKAARRYALAEAEMRGALEELSVLKGAKAGRVAIGAMPLCRARVLPEAIVRFQAHRPECDVYIAEGSYGELIDPLRNGDLDILIGALRTELPGPDIVQAKLFEDWPVVFARYDHPLAGNKTQLDHMVEYEWCLPQKGVPLRERWEQMFERAGLPVPKVRVECGSVTTIRQILMQTDCLTILSPDQMVVEMEAKWVKIVGQTSEDLRRIIGITHRENWRPTDAQQDMINTLRQIA